MPIVFIESLADERLLPYLDLKSPRTVSRGDLFIAEGYWLVRRLLESPFAVESILVDERRLENIVRFADPKIQVLVLREHQVEQVVGFNFHRGVIACGRRCVHATLDDEAGRLTNGELLVMCVGVQDPQNLGLILRNASAARRALGIIRNPKWEDWRERHHGRTRTRIGRRGARAVHA